MKLYRCQEVKPDGTGLVCRQGRLSGAVMVLLFSGILIGLPIVLWQIGAPKFISVILALLAVGIVPMLLGDLRARLRPTNWLLWIHQDGLWINFRSYQDQSEQDALTVVHLDYSEILEAGRFVERFTTPSSEGGSVLQKLESLDIQLQHTDTGELETALAENRHRPQPERVHLGFIRSTVKPTLFSVTLLAADLIRVNWRGGSQHWVSPSLARALDALAGRVNIAESTHEDQQDWAKLSDGEFDDQVLKLVRSGNRMEATKLLVKRRGYTLTKAHQFIEELSSRV